MGGGVQQAPTPYMPRSQPQADTAFQTGTGQLATAGQNLSNAVTPQLSTIASNVTSNPYYAQALTGAQTAANTATGTVAPGQLAGAAQDTGVANNSVAAGNNIYNSTQAAAPVLAGANIGALANLGTTGLSAANQVLNTAFDPQQALYRQQYQQQSDQQNAINAMNGVAGSPYGAGVAGQAATNFNLDWQNNQLARQVSGLGAYDSAASTYAGDTANLTTAATNNLTNLDNTGIGALSTLGNNAVAANTAASNLGTAALNTQATAAQLPQDVFLQQQQADLAALGSQISGTNAANALTQQGVADQGAYLGIGQQASQNTTAAAQANNQANAQSAAGFGQLFGSLTSMFSFAML